MFFTADTQFYIPTNKAQRFQFLCSLVNTLPDLLGQYKVAFFENTDQYHQGCHTTQILVRWGPLGFRVDFLGLSLSE